VSRRAAKAGIKSLFDWIADLEAEEFPKPLDRKIARLFRSDYSACSVRNTRSDPLPFCSHTGRVLQALWSDVSFWKFQKTSPTGEANASYIFKNFGLRLPPLSHEVWFEAARDKRGRKRLFDALTFRPGMLPEVRSGDSESLAEIDRHDRLLADLLLDYIWGSRLDRRRELALLRLTPPAYELIKLAAAKFSKDAAWCEGHPGNIPAAALRKPVGRSAQPETLVRREQLVQIAHRMPEATCYQMVKEYKLSQGERFDFKAGKALRGLRAEATIAKQLAGLRDGVPVTHHIEEGRGRKPRRKNLGAAN
jgi:hypothetical protein